jgi:hypothetical protein
MNNELFSELIAQFNDFRPLKQRRCITQIGDLAQSPFSGDLMPFYEKLAAAFYHHVKPVKPVVASVLNAIDKLLHDFPQMPAEDREQIAAAFSDVSENGETEGLRSYGRGMLKVLDLIMEDERQQPAARPLDLSESSIDDLSKKLSDIMKNPLLPDDIYNCIGDRLADSLSGKDTDSPEALKHMLITLKKQRS